MCRMLYLYEYDGPRSELWAHKLAIQPQGCCLPLIMEPLEVHPPNNYICLVCVMQH